MVKKRIRIPEELHPNPKLEPTMHPTVVHSKTAIVTEHNVPHNSEWTYCSIMRRLWSVLWLIPRVGCCCGKLS